LQLTARNRVYLLAFAALFCWFFSAMVGVTSLQSQNLQDLLLRAIVVGLGGWCGWGLLKGKRQVILFTIGLCCYAVFGSLFWLYSSTLMPLYFGHEVKFGLYDCLAFFYIIGGGIVVWFLLHRDTRQWLKNQN